MKTSEFTNLLGITLHPLQEVIVKVAAGEPLTDDQIPLFEKHAGRPYESSGEPPHEMHALCGRQSGKTSFVAAPYALYVAFDPKTVEGLQAGQWRDVVVVSPTRKQSRIAYSRIRGLIERTPSLQRYVQKVTRNEIELNFGVRIGVWAAESAHLRGIQPRLLLLDEACFLPAEGTRADYEIIDAVKPGMAMVPNGQIITISSPWIEMGYVFEAFRRRATLEDIIVFQATSAELNPLIPQAFLDREEKRDPEAFRREFGAEFIGSINTFFPAEAVNACVISGRTALPPLAGTQYVAAVDQAYRQDTFTLAVAHSEGDTVVVDLLKGWKPRRGRMNQLGQLLPELEAEIAPYNVTTLFGDQYASVPFQELLVGRGLAYHERTFTADSKRDMYASLKDAVLSQRIELLDHDRSLRELRTLEARATATGHVRIEAPRGTGFSDDYADVLAILANELRPSRVANVVAFGDQPEPGFEDRAGIWNMEF